jgi:Protein of unknown function (DUF2442)
MLDSGAVVELVPAGDRPPSRARLQVSVTDVAAVVDAVRAVGVEVRPQPWGAQVVDGAVTIDLRQPNIPDYQVTTVAVTGPATLRVTHRDGATAEHDLTQLIERGGMWSQLADPELFARVYIDHGSIAWPTALDIAPDTLHDHATGVCPGGCWLDACPRPRAGTVILPCGTSSASRPAAWRRRPSPPSSHRPGCARTSSA